MARASSYLTPSSSYLTQAAVRTRCTPRLKHSNPSHSTDPSEAGSRQGVISPPPPFRLSSSMNSGPNTSELPPHLVQRHRLRENVGGVVLARHPAQSEPAFPDGLLDPQNSRLYVPEFSHARAIRDGSCSAGVDMDDKTHLPLQIRGQRLDADSLASGLYQGQLLRLSTREGHRGLRQAPMLNRRSSDCDDAPGRGSPSTDTSRQIGVGEHVDGVRLALVPLERPREPVKLEQVANQPFQFSPGGPCRSRHVSTGLLRGVLHVGPVLREVVGASGQRAGEARGQGGSGGCRRPPLERGARSPRRQALQGVGVREQPNALHELPDVFGVSLVRDLIVLLTEPPAEDRHLALVSPRSTKEPSDFELVLRLHAHPHVMKVFLPPRKVKSSPCTTHRTSRALS